MTDPLIWLLLGVLWGIPVAIVVAVIVKDKHDD